MYEVEIATSADGTDTKEDFLLLKTNNSIPSWLEWFNNMHMAGVTELVESVNF